MTFTSLFRRFNIFSLLLIVAGIAFAMKLVNIVTFSSSHPAAEIGAIMPAAAKDPIASVSEEPPPMAPAAPDQASPSKEDVEKSITETVQAVEDGKATAPDTAVAPGSAQPPTVSLPPMYSQSRAFSATEIDVLQSLSQRRDMLDKREKALDEREALLNAAGQEVDSKIAQLNKIRGELEALLDKQQTEQNDRISSLVKIYEGMKPKEAAAIFDTLDMNVLLSVIGRMNERKSGPILASMSPDKARMVTIRLAEQKQLPTLPDSSSASTEKPDAATATTP